MRKVAAVMVNWNGGDLAIRSAESILAQSAQPVLWVVDNGSTDGSLENIAGLPDSDRVRVIRNPGNYGFARANNQALVQLLDVDYVLLVNNDVLFPDHSSLADVIRHMEQDENSSGACGRYEYPDGSFQHYYQRLPRPFDLMFHFGFLKNFYFAFSATQTSHYMATDLDFSRSQDIPQPAFSCVLLRADHLQKVGTFDERFPIFFNDVDYCQRWFEAGFAWRYFPQWRIIHYRSKTTSTIGRHLTAELAGSVVRYAHKNYGGMTSLFVRCAVMAQCAYRKWLRRDFAGSLRGVWRGELPFTSAAVSLADNLKSQMQQ